MSMPKRLKKEPLIEAIWQVQFEIPGVGNLLPGILYAALIEKHPNLQIQRLPIADIPDVVVQADPNMRYAAKIRIEDASGVFLWQIGDRVVTLNCHKPYVGWDVFREAIVSLIRVIEGSKLVSQPLRHSLRYIDLLTLDEAPNLSALQLKMEIGAGAVFNRPLQMRVELFDEYLTHILQIATPAQVQLPEGIRTGTILDLETFSVDVPGDWDAVRNEIDALHEHSKRMFFEQLLTAEALNKLEPED